MEAKSQRLIEKSVKKGFAKKWQKRVTLEGRMRLKNKYLYDSIWT